MDEGDLSRAELVQVVLRKLGYGTRNRFGRNGTPTTTIQSSGMSRALLSGFLAKTTIRAGLLPMLQPFSVVS